MEFHARFSAYERSYQYLLINQPTAPAIFHQKAGWFHLPLDVQAMQKAIAYFVGEHDFSAFRAAECQAKSPVKHMRKAELCICADSLLFEFTANAFLHHQIRNMVGALIYVGKGKYPPQFIADLLQGKDRTKAPPTFSASGLYLAGVGYESKWGLPCTKRSLGFCGSTESM